VFNYVQIETYAKEYEEMEKSSKEEYLASLRRQSSGFSRGISKYRGVARLDIYIQIYAYYFILKKVKIKIIFLICLLVLSVDASMSMSCKNVPYMCDYMFHIINFTTISTIQIGWLPIFIQKFSNVMSTCMHSMVAVIIYLTIKLYYNEQNFLMKLLKYIY